MGKMFKLLAMMSFLVLSLSLVAADRQVSEIKVPGGRSISLHREISPSDAVSIFNQCVARLQSIGDRAGTESDSKEKSCKELDEKYEKFPKTLYATSDPLIVNPGVVLAPALFSNIVNLPTDTVDPFDHRRWAENLSVANANSAYLNLAGYTIDQLADNLNFGAKRCSAHSDKAGHRYAGYSACCQYYVAGVRQDLISLAAFASRHSRAHAAYVAEVDRFDGQLAVMYAQYSALAAYPGFVHQVRPVKPINNYTPFDFRSWLLRMGTNNNTPAILGLTDRDDPVMMADKVYISGRYSTCGHSDPNTYQYTSWNWCGHHHYTRALKKETFEIAKDLITAQERHTTYVAAAQQFEAQVKALMNYYGGFYGNAFRGVVVPPVAGTGLGPNADAAAIYQALRDNRERLKGYLTEAIGTLKLAADCRTIANEINHAGSKICADSLHYQEQFERLNIELMYAGDRVTTERTGLSDKLESLDQQYKQLLKINEDLAKENESLKNLKNEESFNKRMDELRKEHEKHERERTEAEVIRAKRDLIEKIEADRERIAAFLGKVMWTLNMEQKEEDLDKFQGIPTVERLLGRADTVLLSNVRRIAEKAAAAGNIS